jgi:hypothetical protein
MSICDTWRAWLGPAFAELELSCLCRSPPYDMPGFTRAKVHRDHHLEVAKACFLWVTSPC